MVSYMCDSHKHLPSFLNISISLVSVIFLIDLYKKINYANKNLPPLLQYVPVKCESKCEITKVNIREI